MPLKPDPKIGEYVSIWNYAFTWTSEHPDRDKLWPMKFQIDELGANAYARCIEIFNRQQMARQAEAEAEAEHKIPSPKPNAYNILVENADNDPVLSKLWQHVNAVPDWVDWDQVARGQAVFYRYGMSTFAGLAYQSLLGGFGAGRIVETLARTGGFSPAVARRRLFETAQWTMEITQSLGNIQPGGDGWKSTVQVRFLHAAVRSRIVKLTESRPDFYNTAAWGIPVNDGDAAGTISSFSGLMVWISLPRQGVYMKQDEITDYIALWRYVAYLIGAPTEFFETPEKARHFLESTTYFEIEPTETSKLLAKNLVKGLVNQPPMYPSQDMIVAAARWLNGEQLSNELGLHRPGVIFKALVALNMGFNLIMVFLCRHSRILDAWYIRYMRNMLWTQIVESKSAMSGKKTDFQLTYIPSYDNIPRVMGSYAHSLKRSEVRGVVAIAAGVLAVLAALAAACMLETYLHGDAVQILGHSFSFRTWVRN